MEIYSVYDTASFEEVLDDLCVRFIVNLPEEELASRERVCFQIEEAHWFYEDFVREQNLSFPSLNLRTFLAKIFQHCPPLHKWGMYEDAYADFMLYKKRVPIRGAILLNEAMSHCILVKGWKQSSSWSFPRGKINKDEPDDQCAIREVMEETGFDITDLIDPSQFLVHENLGNNHMKLYIVPGVPEDSVFVPQSRKEISRVEWQALTELPSFSKRKSQNTSGINTGKLFMVVPFMPELRKWIAKRKRQRAKKLHGNARSRAAIEETEPETSAVEASPTRTLPNNFFGVDDSRSSEVLRSMLGIGAEQSNSLPIFQNNNSVQPPPRVSTVSPQVAGASLLALLKGGARQENVPLEEVATAQAEQQPAGRQISLSELFSSAPKKSSAPQSNMSPQSAFSAPRPLLQPGFIEPPMIGVASPGPALLSPYLGPDGMVLPLHPPYPVPVQMIPMVVPEVPSYPHSATSTLPMKLSNQSSALLQMLKSGSGPASPPPPGPASASSTLSRPIEKPKVSLLDALIPTAPAKPPDAAHAVSLLEILRGAAPPPPSEPSVKALPLQPDLGLLAPPSHRPVIANGSGRATPVQPLLPTPKVEQQPSSALQTTSLNAQLRSGVVQSSPQPSSVGPALSQYEEAAASPYLPPPSPVEGHNTIIQTVSAEVLKPVAVQPNTALSPTISTKDLGGTFDRRKVVDNQQAQKLLDIFKTSSPVATKASPVIPIILPSAQPEIPAAAENLPPKQAAPPVKRATSTTPDANLFLLGYLDEVAKKYGK